MERRVDPRRIAGLFNLQAKDAFAVLEGVNVERVGLSGYSQSAWIAVEGCRVWIEEMDFDHAPAFAKVRVPTLLLYSEADSWTLVSPSFEACVRLAATTSTSYLQPSARAAKGIPRDFYSFGQVASSVTPRTGVVVPPRRFRWLAGPVG